MEPFFCISVVSLGVFLLWERRSKGSVSSLLYVSFRKDTVLLFFRGSFFRASTLLRGFFPLLLFFVATFSVLVQIDFSGLVFPHPARSNPPPSMIKNLLDFDFAIVYATMRRDSSPLPHFFCSRWMLPLARAPAHAYEHALS